MKKKIRQRILINFFSISMLGILLITFTGVYFAREAALQKHYESTRQMATEILFNVKNTYENASRNVNVIAQSYEVSDNLNNPDILEKELQRLKKLLGTYDDLTLLKPNGEVIVSTDYNFNTGWKFRSFFKDTINEKKPQISEPYFLPDPLRYITTFTAPILSESNQVRAVVTAQLNMEQVQNIVNHVSLGESGYGFLINKNKIHLSHPLKDKILKEVNPQIWQQINSGSTLVSQRANKGIFIGSYAKDPNNIMVIMQNKDEVLSGFSKIFRDIIIIAFLVSIIALILGNRFSRTITTPIELLDESIQKFTDGDSKARVELNSEDEIGDLAKNFNKMVQEVTLFRNELEKLVKERTEELEEARDAADSANQAKSAFLANMSHEIRTPMNAILGFSQILQTMESDEEKKHFLASIITGGKTLLSIINDILDVSKLEAGKFVLNLSKVSVKSIFEDTCAILRNEARKKNLTLDYEIADEFPPVIIADEHRLRQIMINLVGNAIKFTDEGFVKLKADWEFADELKKFASIELKVVDSGIGIDQQEHEDIFQEFMQSKNQGDKLYQGTGLGLSICKKLVSLMNGSMNIESSLNQGASFEVHLPKVEIGELNIDSDSSSSMNLEFLNFHKSKVLIVDDNTSNLDFLSNLLSSKNLNVKTTVKGEEALTLTQEFKPEIILMDLKMPRVSGYQAAEAIKSHVDLKNIPIIAVSASIVDKEKDSFKNLFVSLIPKPVEAERIFDELTRYLNHSFDTLDYKKRA